MLLSPGGQCFFCLIPQKWMNVPCRIQLLSNHRTSLHYFHYASVSTPIRSATHHYFCDSLFQSHNATIMDSDDNHELKKNSIDYFKSMQHAGQRPMTNILPYPIGLGDYMHTPLIGICRAAFLLANGVHQTSWSGRFSANWPHTSTKYQSTRWNWNHDLRLTISGLVKNDSFRHVLAWFVN